MAENKLSNGYDIQLGAILKHIADGVILIDQRGSILLFNLAATKMFGYQESEVLGKNVSMLMPEPYAKDHEDHLKRFLNGVEGRAIGQKRELEGRRKDGSTFPLLLAAVEVETQIERQFVATITDLTESREAAAKNKLLAAAVEHAADTIMVLDPNGLVEYVNPRFEQQSGYKAEQVLGRLPMAFSSGAESMETYGKLKDLLARGEEWKGTINRKSADGSPSEAELSLSPVYDKDSGKLINLVAVIRDLNEQRALERKLQHAQKLEAVGQLAAGIAHEINTPTQFIGDNAQFLKEAFSDLSELLIELSAQLITAGDQGLVIDTVQALMDKADVDYLLEEIPRAIKDAQDGVARVSKIVGAMKEFSHPGAEKLEVDLNRAIESTITVAINEWRYVATMETELDPNLPFVWCTPGEINQVILNIIVNAAHAISDVVANCDDQQLGVISVSTQTRDGFVEIRIRDSGTGMPEEVKKRIFDPFYTTKEVGKGTGQGLSIAHDVIVERHGGTIGVESTEGSGTCFVIGLPLEGTHQNTKV